MKQIIANSKIRFTYEIMTFIVDDSMAWTNERLKLSCTESITFKNLWKMIVLDNNNNNSNNNVSIHVNIYIYYI